MSERKVQEVIRTVRIIQEQCARIGQTFRLSEKKLVAYGLSKNEVMLVQFLTVRKP